MATKNNIPRVVVMVLRVGGSDPWRAIAHKGRGLPADIKHFQSQDQAKRWCEKHHEGDVVWQTRTYGLVGYDKIEGA